ncbi:MAG: APC family permease [Chloroflexi bacterium]|nr:APC family permease [Chloroflexota bacterium]
MSDAAVPRPAGVEGVFVRRSSGLTRLVSPLDALMFSSMNPGLTNNFIFMMWAMYLYPGVNYPIAIIFVLLMLPISILYWFFSMAMPRSGGEYIYITRTLHPAIGFMGSAVITLLVGTTLGLNTDWATLYGLAGGFAGIALQPGHQWAVGVSDFFYSQWGRTIVGTISMVMLAYLWIRGTKWVMRYSWAVVAITAVGLIWALIEVIAAGGQAGFIAGWNALSDVSYNDVLKMASDKGFVISYLAMPTLMAGLTYAALNTLGWTFSSNIAGEIRDVRKSQFFALVGALLVLMVSWIFGSQLLYSAIGGDFMSAMNQILHSAPESYPAIMKGQEPIFTLLLGFMTNNVPFLMFFLFMFWISTWATPVGMGYGCLRNIFAWSFDRILPARFAELDKRYHSPVLTIIVYCTIGEIFLNLYIWHSQFMAFGAYWVMAFFVIWILLGITGVLFPLRRKNMFDMAAPLVKAKFLGVPVIAIMGGYTAILCVAVEIFILQPFLQGLTPWTELITVSIMFIVPLIGYYVSKAYRAHSAVPLDAQFTQIPPE